MAASWRAHSAWMAGGSLYVRDHPTPTRVPLDQVDAVLFVDATTRSTPWWAVVLAVVLFPIGLLFLLAKNTQPQTQVRIHARGCPVPVTAWSPYDVDRTRAEWWPVLAASKLRTS